MEQGCRYIDYIENKKYFFGQNILRRLLILHFFTFLFFFKKNKFNAYLRIGSLYLNLKKFEKSKWHYEKAYEVSMDAVQRVRALVCMGNLSFISKSYAKAISFYEEALKITRFKTTILSNLAFVYEALGEYEKALKYAQDSITVSKQETELAHTISPEDNVRDLIIRLNEKRATEHC